MFIYTHFVVPETTVRILTVPKEENLFHVNTRLQLICVVEYIAEVDTDVTFYTIWTSKSDSFQQDEVNSTIIIDALTWNDSDIYVCTAHTVPSNESATFVKGSTSTEEQTINVCKYIAKLGNSIYVFVNTSNFSFLSTKCHHSSGLQSST